MNLIIRKKILNCLFLSVFTTFVFLFFRGAQSSWTAFFIGATVSLFNLLLLVSSIPDNNGNINVFASFLKRFFLRISVVLMLFLGFLFLCRVNLMFFIVGFSSMFLVVMISFYKSLLVTIKE